MLRLGLNGGSINSITRALRGKSVAINRDTVRKILKYARVYAGIYHWGHKDIEGLVPPRITLEEAEAIEGIMRRNKQQSYGWGKRKWLTGRVRCGLCGSSYALELGKKRCHCRRSSKLEYLDPCSAPRVAYKKLENNVWLLLNQNLCQPEVLRSHLSEMRDNWQKELSKLNDQCADIKAQLKRFEDKRQRLLWQHSEGLITDEKLKAQLKSVEPNAKALQERLSELSRLATQPEPPDPNRADELWERWARDIFDFNYLPANEERKAEIADDFNLQATIYPAVDAQLKLQITANIPLEADTAKLGQGGAIVCPSPPRR